MITLFSDNAVSEIAGLIGALGLMATLTVMLGGFFFMIWLADRNPH